MIRPKFIFLTIRLKNRRARGRHTSVRPRRADATYFDSIGVDETTDINYGVDMTPLMNDLDLNPTEFVAQFIQRFATNVREWIMKSS